MAKLRLRMARVPLIPRETGWLMEATGVRRVSLPVTEWQQGLDHQARYTPLAISAATKALVLVLLPTGGAVLVGLMVQVLMSAFGLGLEGLMVGIVVGGLGGLLLAQGLVGKEKRPQWFMLRRFEGEEGERKAVVEGYVHRANRPEYWAVLNGAKAEAVTDRTAKGVYRAMKGREYRPFFHFGRDMWQKLQIGGLMALVALLAFLFMFLAIATYGEGA